MMKSIFKLLLVGFALVVGASAIWGGHLDCNLTLQPQDAIWAIAACLPNGTCSATHAIEDFEIEDRVYGREDAKLLRALGFQDAIMLQDQKYVTIMPDVKTKERLVREEFESGYQSKATGGRGKLDCGPFTPKGRYTDFNKTIYTYYMYNEVALCYKKLIRSFKQSMLRKGAGGAELNTMMNDFIVSNILKNNNIQTDKLIWHGDYKSPNHTITHYDGFVKKAALAIGASTKHKINFLFSGLTAGDVIEGRVGGYDISVPFNTDNATTVGDLRTALTALTNSMTGGAMFTISGAGANAAIEAINARDLVEVVLAVTDGTGLNSCDEAVEPGVGVFTKTTVTEQTIADTPMVIDYDTIDSTNVLDILEAIYLKINSDAPWLLTDPGFNIHISQAVSASLAIAMTKMTSSFKGLGKVDSETPFALPIVPQPYLMGNVIMGFSNKNAFFATDLVSDLSEMEQWVDRKCQEVNFRGETYQGVEFGDATEVICNLNGHPFTFQDAAPTTGDV